jgi:hypothetical protein
MTESPLTTISGNLYNSTHRHDADAQLSIISTNQESMTYCPATITGPPSCGGVRCTPFGTAGCSRSVSLMTA